MMRNENAACPPRAGPNTLPSIFGDETIYSWCATSHAMSCGKSAAETGRRLMGAAHAVRQHDLPSAMAALPLVDEGSVTSVVDCLRAHTIAGYYLPFLSTVDQSSVGEAVCSGRDSLWRRRVSAVSRTRPTEHPLKWCHLCARTDAETVGRSYWHSDLQFPTTWLCRIHGTPLSFLSGRGKRWLLPQASSRAPTPTLSDMQAAATLSAVGASLRRVVSADVASLRQVAILRLQEVGVIHSAGGARHERIMKWFAGTGVASVCRDEPTGLTQLCGGDWIPEILWRKKLKHAVRWIVLWAATDWDLPERATRAFEDAASGQRSSDDAQLQLFESDAPLRQRAPSRVQQAFAVSDSYGEVMARLLVSRADVVRWLERDPMLRAEWRQRLKQGKQLQCVTRIQSLTSGAPDLTPQQLESTCGAEIRWLREHAPTLLSTMLKSVSGRSSAQGNIFQTARVDGAQATPATQP